MAANDNDRGLVVNYVPNELCLVVESPAPGSDDARIVLYEDVLRVLNERIRQRLPATKWRDDDPFELDLAPRLLQQQLDAKVLPVLAGLRRALAHGNGRDPALDASIHFPPVKGDGPTTSLLFYQFGDPVAPDNPEALIIQLQIIRELVLWFNRHGLRAADEDQRPWRLLAATPNWLSVAAQHSCGSPGGRPQPVPPEKAGHWEFKFGQEGQESAAQELVQQVRDAEALEAEVIVAVLDTRPARALFERQADKFPKESNWLYHETLGRLQWAADWSNGLQVFGHVADYLPGWLVQPAGQNHAPYLVPDHGLFAAGIVCDIARKAGVHLVRVLSDYGIGDLWALSRALRWLPDQFLTERSRRLVVNLSLGVDVPPNDNLLYLWFGRTAEDQAALLRRWGDICAIQHSLQASLFTAFEWLKQYRERMLVVAASGNDAQRPDAKQQTRASRPEPRLPARYDSVLGVAAVRTDLRPSIYSNRGDVPVMGNAVATVGGNADHEHITFDAAGEPDAIKGIFCSDPLPLGAGPNQTGWAYWVGTSFATPIISGLAANLWAVNAGLDADGLIRKVVSLIGLAEAELDCSAITVRQVLT